MMRSVSYRNQSIDLQSKSMDWFLYGKGLRHERVNLLSTHFKSMFHLYIPWKRCTKTILKLEFQKHNLRLPFLPFTGPKKDLILAPRNNWFWLILEQVSVCIGAQQVKYFQSDKYMFKVRKRKVVAAKYVQS